MLTNYEKATLLDIASYIIWSVNHENSFGFTLANVGHDVAGIMSQEVDFLPRSNGYQKVLSSDFGVNVGG